LLFLGGAGTIWAAESPVAQDDRLAAASLEILADGRLTGSGSFVTSAGLALTAAHAVKGAKRLEVLSPVAGRLGARVVATDLGHDLALLLVDRNAGLFPALDLAETGPGLGDPVYLFGSALFRHGLRLPGVVAKVQPQFEWNGNNRCYTEVEVVAAMTPEGLSGGPWVDGDGRLIGVQNGMVARNGSPVGLAFMSPLAAVQRLVATRQGAAAASLGGQFAEIWEWSPEGAARSTDPAGGIYVIDVLPGGPLAAAGVGRGDRIVTVNGVRMVYRDELLAIIRQLAPGDHAELAVITTTGVRKSVTVGLADCSLF
jgi:S1-C subfamily serine protease